MSKSDYSAHVMIVAWINIVFSVLFAFVGLFAFFFLTGTGIGIYSLWVLSRQEAATYFGAAPSAPTPVAE